MIQHLADNQEKGTYSSHVLTQLLCRGLAAPAKFPANNTPRIFNSAEAGKQS